LQPLESNTIGTLDPSGKVIKLELLVVFVVLVVLVLLEFVVDPPLITFYTVLLVHTPFTRI
jgi:hypothetical protein